MRGADFLIIGVSYTPSLGQASLIPGIVMSRGHIFCLALHSHAKIKRFNVELAFTHRISVEGWKMQWVLQVTSQRSLNGRLCAVGKVVMKFSEVGEVEIRCKHTRRKVCEKHTSPKTEHILRW